MSVPDSKTCTRCGETKPLGEFYRQVGCKHDRSPRCKVCKRAESKAWRAANLDAAREADRKRYAENPERRAATMRRSREHYEENRAKHLQRRQEYYARKPEVYEKARAKRKALRKSVEHQPYGRREIWERDGGECRNCRKPLPYKKGAFQIDHIVPISLGGPDIPANLQLLCPPCNRTKWANLEGQIHLPV